MISLAVTTPATFQFEATVMSHGWYQLAPFTYDASSKTLTYPYRLSNGELLSVTMRGGRGRSIILQATSHKRMIIDSAARNEMQIAVRRMFNLESNLQPFHDSLRKNPDYAWVAEHSLGRLLAAPTVWENLAKTLMTTNIAWDNTLQIVEKLVALDPDGAFPTPARIAAMSEDDLNEAIGAGYRTPHLLKMAQRIAAGELSVEAWWSLDSDALYKAIKELDGLGDYAAGSVLRLLGHFDKLAIDSMARNAYEHVTGQEAESDTDIREYYAQFGEWSGLVMWMDSIRDRYEAEPETEVLVEA